MDTSAILAFNIETDNAAIPIRAFEMLQQATAQLAAIREAVEHELAQQIVKRRREAGWPPPNTAPHSHIG